MSADGWCAEHQDRLHAAQDARFACETLVVLRVLETGRGSSANGCWACSLSESEFQAALREGCILVVSAEAHGGTYTTKDVSVSIKQEKPDGNGV